MVPGSRLWSAMTSVASKRNENSLRIGATQKLAEWVSSLSVEFLPESVIDRARDCISDGLACAAAGLAQSESRYLIDSIQRVDPTGPGQIWFTGQQCSSLSEAFINASLIHSLDWDDSHRQSKTHPGAPVIAAAFAVARLVNADLGDLLAGIVAGYEVSMRLGSSVDVVAHRRSGWHATSTCGSIGAAAAAARVMGLDADTTASALGLGATQAAGIWAFKNDGTMSKKMHPGHAARAGVTAAILASNGYTGSRVALEAVDGGFFTAFAPGVPTEQWGTTLDHIGNPFWLPEVAFKPYPCCRTAHTAIDAILSLRSEGLTPADVKSIQVSTFAIGVEQCGFNDPVNATQGAFSTPYLVACALQDGWVRPSHFTPEAVVDKTIVALQRKVQVIHDPSLDAFFPKVWPCRVKAVLHSGEIREKQVDVALGDPAAPMEASQWEQKWLAADPNLQGVKGLASFVRSLPLQGSSSELWRRLSLGASQPNL